MQARAAIVDEDVAMGVYEGVAQSVVSIVNSTAKGGVQTVTGIGSGLVWAVDASGGAWVITNYHCVSRLDKGTDTTQVVLSAPNGTALRAWPAQLTATDTQNDLAVLRIDGVADSAPAGQPPATMLSTSNTSGSTASLATTLRAAKFGTSADLQVGQTVHAVGNPWGLSRTLSVGVVSGLNRSIPSPVGTLIPGAIQTDARINAGNSGGPLLDSAGRVVGINTASFTRAGSGLGSGVNFALPIDMVRTVVPQLIVYGNARGKRI